MVATAVTTRTIKITANTMAQVPMRSLPALKVEHLKDLTKRNEWVTEVASKGHQRRASSAYLLFHSIQNYHNAILLAGLGITLPYKQRASHAYMDDWLSTA
ncbi:hypothetical protein ONZ43_g6334 [Nemania bipapillata]|uniref:Uncharacterized protein n=1 Tax=Nemania bipapillata TaxID=110536 RepID=A0ACC2I082_9PEZI|nr:hypothetical protein ONZ43_g6334 [Nemania bipapillata]